MSQLPARMSGHLSLIWSARCTGKTGTSDLMRIVYEVDEPPDTIAQWIESNIGNIRDRTRYFQAYGHLLKADEYIGLTYRQQYHTLWRYATALTVLGVSDAAGAGESRTESYLPSGGERSEVTGSRK